MPYNSVNIYVHLSKVSILAADPSDAQPSQEAYILDRLWVKEVQ